MQLDDADGLGRGLRNFPTFTTKLNAMATMKGYTKEDPKKGQQDDAKPYEQAAINDMHARAALSNKRVPMPNRPPITPGNKRVPLKKRI